MTELQIQLLPSMAKGPKSIWDLYRIMRPNGHRLGRKSGGPSRGGPDNAQVAINFYMNRYLRGLAEWPYKRRYGSKVVDRLQEYKLTDAGRKALLKYLVWRHIQPLYPFFRREGKLS